VALLPWHGAALGAFVAACAIGAWWSWRGLSHRLGTDWLMRLYGFSHAQAAGRITGLDARVDTMAAMIAEAVDDAPEAGEVLVVGHSTGATLAASALARALRRSPRLGVQGPRLGLLTLGQCIPLVYGFDTASALRAELDALTTHPQLTWVDFTAPADWAGCGQISPWLSEGQAVLHRLSPRFPKILEPAHYQRLRRNRLAMHMQYLKPADRAGHYDLLALTAGRPTLRERHPPKAYPGA
jgi:pimeloyl-ACP methyl ester carboxylesterase